MNMQRLIGVVFAATFTCWAKTALPQPRNECLDTVRPPTMAKLLESGTVEVFSAPTEGYAMAQYPEYYSNEKWGVTCENDAMTDERSCVVVSVTGPADLYFGWIGTPQVNGVCIKENDFPGKRGQVRIGDAPAISTDTGGCIHTESAIRQIESAKPGTRVRTRNFHWPDELPVDHDFKITSTLDDAISLAQCLYGPSKPSKLP